MALDLGVTPHGLIDIELGDRRYTFENQVLNAGWAAMLSQVNADTAVPRWLTFGTEATEPDANDPGLLAPALETEREAKAIRYGGQLDVTRLRAYSEATVEFEYAPGELAGEWNELSLAFEPGYRRPFNRALIRDENGVACPLIVLSSEPVKLTLRLRLVFSGWGQRIALPEFGQYGVLTPDSQLAGEQGGLWRQGLPMPRADFGNVLARPEGLAAGNGAVTHYFAVAPSVDWHASRLTLQGGAGQSLCHIDLERPITKPAGLTYYLRAHLQVRRI